TRSEAWLPAGGKLQLGVQPLAGGSSTAMLAAAVLAGPAPAPFQPAASGSQLVAAPPLRKTVNRPAATRAVATAAPAVTSRKRRGPGAKRGGPAGAGGCGPAACC